MASKTQYMITVEYKSGRIENLPMKNKTRWEETYDDLKRMQTVKEVKKWTKQV